MKKVAVLGLGLMGGFVAAMFALPEAKGAADASAYGQLDLFSDAFERVRANYVRPVKDSELIDAAIQGMVSNLDPHSSYMDAKSYGDMQITTKGQFGGEVDLTYSGGAFSGPRAFAEAGVKPSDIKYASIYDSFTITVLQQIEDMGFCERGKGGKFVSDGNLISGVGKLPFNTDGGGLCNNHPANRGGITKVIEAVRQLRGEAHPKVQVPNCDIALAHGTGGLIGSRHGSATLIMERE